MDSLSHGRTGLSNSELLGWVHGQRDERAAEAHPEGERTRARIVEEAAALIHERGVAATTLEDVKVAAEVSGSQLYHYFPDKDDLVQAVIDYHAEASSVATGRPSAARTESRLGGRW